jgi:mannonate dehydratase
MKLGFGLYSHMLNSEGYAFAKQVGATHIVAHLVDYFHQGSASAAANQPVGDEDGWGRAGKNADWFTYDRMRALRMDIESHGLELAAIENFDPTLWHDVLLDGPKRDAQIEQLKTIVRDAGKAGVPAIGYNFSLAGVAGRITGPFARGGAVSVGMEGGDESPVPPGMVWNMRYSDTEVADVSSDVTHDELWDRLTVFLTALVPVAEEAGVRLAAHPDDPPMAKVRQTPRLVYQPHMYQRLIDIAPSRANGLEFCLGTIAEMTEGDPYEAIDTYSKQDRIVYIHLRNVRGHVPNYQETFIDDGDLDIPRALRILYANGYDGVITPDHAPLLTCAAPWHAGMAYAMGYLRAAMH